MNRTDLLTQAARRSGVVEHEARAVLDAVEALVAESLARGEKVQLPGFLTLEPVQRPERAGRNPRTGEAIVVAARRAVSVSAGSRLKDAVRR